MTRSDPEKGFTLVEALMAVLILAIIASLLVPAVRGSLRLQQRITAQMIEREGHSRLVRLLTEAVDHVQPTPSGYDYPAVEGGESRLQIVTRVPRTGRVSRFTLSLARDQAELELIPLSGQLGSEETRVQVQGIGTNPRFFYFGESETRDSVVWRDDWPYTHLPRLIVLDFEPVDGQTRRVELLLPSTGGFTCAFDSGLGACLAEGP